ncbi:hypothetical protein [Thalassotalea eurytherma]|uniref:Cell surface protein n=1 Tax=Thalassotalea eurytherma TaxID=1144278 RepID=A0ABQ6H528_9GAMM|nr:hypothetical protein [Thalassotalea eurytherma]GLX83261.1 hypothetical protein theurythT_27130 [Thalassotalea eurytherma]
MNILKNTLLLTATVSTVFLSACSIDSTEKSVEEPPLSQIITKSCAWQGPYVKENPATNIAYPDAGAYYWSMKGALPEGAKLTLTGKYPKARYFSFNSYKMDGTIMPFDAIKDTEIAPELGQPANPYINGNQRNVDSYYTLSFSPIRNTDESSILEQLEQNTMGLAIHDSNLYPEPDDGWPFPTFSTQENGFELVYRVYLPNQGLDEFGEAGLPQFELEYNGEILVNQEEICGVLDVTDTTIQVPLVPIESYLGIKAMGGNPYGDNAVNTRLFAGTPYYYDTYDAAEFDKSDPLSTAGFTLKGAEEMRDIVFRASFPMTDLLPCAFLGTCDRSMVNRPGFYANKDNSYVSTWLNNELGDVVVFKGKLPVTPLTINNQDMYDHSGVQMRYWSLCTNEFYSQRVVDCIFDEEVIIDDDRDFVIVTSKAVNRPTNATKECGYNWIELPELGDNVSMEHDSAKLTGQINNDNDAFVIIRNMVAEPDFTQATSNIDSFRAEKAIMGEYLPEGEYMSVGDFELLECRL